LGPTSKQSPAVVSWPTCPRRRNNLSETNLHAALLQIMRNRVPSNGLLDDAGSYNRRQARSRRFTFKESEAAFSI
jgi:hypothetical protein